MPYFRVELTATAMVENTLVVRADSPEDAADEALKQLNEVVWQYAGLTDDPVEIVLVTESSQGGLSRE